MSIINQNIVNPDGSINTSRSFLDQKTNRSNRSFSTLTTQREMDASMDMDLCSNRSYGSTKSFIVTPKKDKKGMISVPPIILEEETPRRTTRSHSRNSTNRDTNRQDDRQSTSRQSTSRQNSHRSTNHRMNDEYSNLPTIRERSCSPPPAIRIPTNPGETSRKTSNQLVSVPKCDKIGLSNHQMIPQMNNCLPFAPDYFTTNSNRFSISRGPAVNIHVKSRDGDEASMCLSKKAAANFSMQGLQIQLSIDD